MDTETAGHRNAAGVAVAGTKMQCPDNLQHECGYRDTGKDRAVHE
jgi:hypothetical protein